MAVHGKFGKPCPVCGTKVQRIRYADNETNYCPRCQTGGRLLADRVVVAPVEVGLAEIHRRAGAAATLTRPGASRQTERWPRVIAHADMDAFYASIEQLDDPELRGRPLLIGPNSSRGVVLTASYEARPFGVGSAMPMARARRLCPEALIVPPRFDRYSQVSAAVMKLFGDFSPDVEPLSLDEAFLDMTGSERLFGSPEAMGRKLKDTVREATGLTVSVGVSGTKYVAKVASGFRKPDGLDGRGAARGARVARSARGCEPLGRGAEDRGAPRGARVPHDRRRGGVRSETVAAGPRRFGAAILLARARRGLPHRRARSHARGA